MQREAKLQLLHVLAGQIVMPEVLHEHHCVEMHLDPMWQCRYKLPPVVRIEVVAVDLCGVLVWSLDDE